MEPSPINPVPANTVTVHIHGSPVDTETVHIHGNPIGAGTIQVHKSMQTGIQIPQKGNIPKGSIHGFAELIQEFGVQFVTYSQVPQPVNALLSTKMKFGETLHSYASRYWELYNEIGGGNEKIAASTFRMGLPEDSELRESLTRKPPKDMRQLMRRIEEYKRLEDDRLQSKGKALLVSRLQQGGFQSRSRKDLRIQESEVQLGEVNVTFKESVHKIIDRIKNESYF
ncbi:uncharacterized protein LOC115965716 [Quercus lobata]|uniref:uncharacterized protein LOC115965716 n=1 Tax=Quercus lobata TaxID=97700 RepID=UPI0012493C7F|nr:uncharacterized protein LOC115965716 [Quercus lobata]